MNPIANILQSYEVMILDGALATELENRGCELNDPLWSAKILLEQPELIKQVHADYFAAGADCAITCSYQASFEGFARRGFGEEAAADLMRLSVRLAVAARDEFWCNPANRTDRAKPIIAASVGSYGAYLADGSEYRGDYGLSESELIDFHRPRLSVLAGAEIDMIACETIPCLLEAQALTRLIAEFPQLTAWISFSAKDEIHISHGETLADCVAWLNAYPQIVAVGINCSPPKYMPGLIKAARSKTNKPIIVYPNSGETYSTENQTWLSHGEPDSYHQLSQYWHQCGAQIIGGCCRTTPADIKQIANWARTP
ncbi:MAG: homocysteine S-methyltransferase [Candidatus Parabeggiatoa sp. nov. 1]|nr:MAG: homocysteine S-methyltransferase [Gammaproteobacteria bacterium]